MYNNFLVKLQAEDATNFLKTALNNVVKKFTFTNKSNKTFNVFSYFIYDSGKRVQLKLRYFDGLNSETLEQDIKQTLQFNSISKSYHIADLVIDESVKSDENLFSKGGYKSAEVIALPMGDLPENVDNLEAFKFFKDMLVKICDELEIELSKYGYVVFYKEPMDITDEVFIQDNRLKSTEYGKDIEQVIRFLVNESYIYYVEKLKSSDDLLKLDKFTEVTFDFKRIQNIYTNLVDVYISSSNFQSIFKNLVYKLNILQKSNIDFELKIKDIVTLIENDSELNNYIDGVINCFKSNKQLNYQHQVALPNGTLVNASKYTSDYINHFFKLFEDYVLEIPFITYKGTWDITFAKDFSGIRTPVRKNDMYEVIGKGPVVIGGIEWNTGDYLLVTNTGSVLEGNVKKLDNQIGSKIKQNLTAEAIYSNFIKKIVSWTIADLYRDYEGVTLDRLEKDIKDKLPQSELEKFYKTDTDNIDIDEKQKTEEEEVKQEEEKITIDNNGVEDDSQIAEKLYNDHEFILSGFAQKGEYTEFAKQQFNEYLLGKGMEMSEDATTGNVYILDSNNNIVSNEETGQILEDFAINEGILNENKEFDESADLSQYLKIKQLNDPSKNLNNFKVSNNYILNRAASPKVYNYFITVAQTDKLYLERLNNYILQQKNEFDQSKLSKDTIIDNIVKQVYTLPVDVDLSKSLLMACNFPVDPLNKWLDHLASVVNFSILILDVFLKERDHKIAMNILKGIFNQQTSLSKYFNKSQLQAVDSSIFDRLKFVDEHKVVFDIKLFLNYIQTLGYIYELDEHNLKLKSIIKAYKKADNVVLNKNDIEKLLAKFNKKYNKILTYDQLFSTQINYYDLQLSRPVTDLKLKQQKDQDATDTSDTIISEELEPAINEYLISLNNEGINNLRAKLKEIENNINNIKWEEINVE